MGRFRREPGRKRRRETWILTCRERYGRGEARRDRCRVERESPSIRRRESRGGRRRRSPQAARCAVGVQARGAGAALPRRSTRVRRTRSSSPADGRESAGIGRRHGAHEVVDFARASATSRCARPRACGRRNRSPAPGPAGCAARSRATSCGQARGRASCSAATVTLSNTSRAVSSGRIGTAVCATMSPASGFFDHVVQRRAGFALAVQHRPVHRRAAAILRQQRAVHVERAARRNREQRRPQHLPVVEAEQEVGRKLADARDDVRCVGVGGRDARQCRVRRRRRRRARTRSSRRDRRRA